MSRVIASAPPPKPPLSSPKRSPPAHQPVLETARPLNLNPEEADMRFLGLIRDIRAEAQNISKYLQDIKKICELTDQKVREQELKSFLQQNLEVLEYNKTQIQDRVKELRKLAETYPQIYDMNGDVIAIIENLWQRIAVNLPRSPDEEANQILQRLPKIDKDVNELVFEAGYLTIPPRLNQHLEQLRTGRCLDFHSTFEDELPKREDRVKILSLLYTHPLAVDGVVDVENGLVYRASRKQSRRWASLALIMATFLAGTIAVYLLAYLGSLLNIENWPIGPSRFTELLVGYLFLTVGGIAHIGIDVLKQARAEKGQSFMAIEDLALWIHVKELSISAGIGSVIIGIIGLAFLTPKVEWQTAFFVGYSIDSFVDLFLQRFGKTVATSTEALKEKMG